eukprot:TRINITY_DN4996_c0_g2_i5.p1 TRINITY_DN4996_c0_g2~~TRINITY_DN4996_c0_g2_i5.p1  ORF type:complete len:194 (-),score=0.48 TRINITY_DN4996_c0_g2_i5:1078-1659(-)
MQRDGCLGMSNVCADMFPEAPITIRFCFTRYLELNMIPTLAGAPWASKLQDWAPSIIQLNVGVRWQADEDLVRGVTNAVTFIRQTLPDALVIWRTTHVGHTNCWQYKGPITEPQDPDGLLHKWNLIYIQRLILRPILKPFGVIWMDIGPLMLLRPDGHCEETETTPTDCLHYCQPGPVDTWVTFLYHILKRLL